MTNRESKWPPLVKKTLRRYVTKTGPQLTFLMFRLSRSPGIRERQSAVFISKKQGQLVHFYAVFLAIACKFPETRSNRTDLAQTLFVNWSSSSFCCWTWFRSDAIGKFWKSSLELFGFIIHLKNQFPLPRTFLSKMAKTKNSWKWKRSSPIILFWGIVSEPSLTTSCMAFGTLVN